ncbi:hypothetical protein NDU88_001463 [Pleurodeles waltl]|uniref:BON domain-containing protein n=1 Tax=Pleurodeles waltl TaxID=8319 RepID=A0AAV7U6H4_PLEWA|nr:hypothetical protein NDU88_001463 [Pleurodeles waltl]
MERYYGAIYYARSGFTAPDSYGGPEGVWETPAPAEELSHAELLAAIQGSQVVLQGKIEAVAVEVNLLRTDLRKVSDKVKVVEGSIVDLQAEAGTGRSVRPIRGAARASGVDDTDWRKRGESQTQISAQGAAGSDGRVEIQQDGTMAVVVPEITDESTEPSDARMESVSV